MERVRSAMVGLVKCGEVKAAVLPSPHLLQELGVGGACRDTIFLIISWIFLSHSAALLEETADTPLIFADTSC